MLPLEFSINGELRNVVLPAALTVAFAETYVAAARLGLGLIQVPRYHVKADLAAARWSTCSPHSHPHRRPFPCSIPIAGNSRRTYASSSTG